jgi:NADH dehydrogenase
MKIVLVGGSGFLGKYVIRALAADGHDCVVLTRAPERAREHALEPRARLVKADVYDSQVLAGQLEGAGAVVSMAGILNEAGFGGRGFHRVHVELVEGIIAACRQAGVQRILHVSALNAGRGQSHYLRTKGEAEALLRQADDLDVTIFQPSVIFGPGDDFFNRFATLLRLMPVLPLACPDARLQPVFAGDVAAAVARALKDPGSIGETYQLGGPRDYRLIELVRWTASALGLKRRILPLPNAAARLQARAMDLVPGKPFSTDNYLSLQVDNVAPENALPRLGITPATIEAVVPTYLGATHRQRHLAELRRRARR